MKTSIPRIRNVRFKAGGEVHLLADPNAWVRPYVERKVHEVIEIHCKADGKIQGFAFIVWDAAVGSTCVLRTFIGSNVPLPLAPDYIRNRLLISIAEEWTLDEMDHQLFGPRPDNAS